jgi:hypothetical protein
VSLRAYALDVAYIERWAGALGVEEMWARVRRDTGA